MCGTQVIHWAPQVTPTVIVQGYGQQPQWKKGLITKHLGPFLPLGEGGDTRQGKPSASARLWRVRGFRIEGGGRAEITCLDR